MQQSAVRTDRKDTDSRRLARRDAADSIGSRNLLIVATVTFIALATIRYLLPWTKEQGGIVSLATLLEGRGGGGGGGGGGGEGGIAKGDIAKVL